MRKKKVKEGVMDSTAVLATKTPMQPPMVYNEKSHKGGLCHHPSHKGKHGGLVHAKEKSSESQGENADPGT